ncbi:bifunctional folylpolyglutamate synthase/dihydrofolate synthase [Planococcus maritimus]|uniref:bifunctional folylpolyglutamate synthase/dihydrofolate synthase n=1 Tax=Planococcus maritimus TaxID=192421 RepID=UPI00080F0D24|nr:Mur ligase family protein [Planococcus maritimus]ANU16927.1 bifunctional folylpolyglutamate synthase/dihydrofolate synthase [Planococcus maritimus]
MITGLDHYKEKWGIRSDAAIQPGLEAMESALAELGHPHHGLPFIHIAGTNGKGSTAAFISSILMAHGKRVGNFFSPAIEDVHDQIQINRQPVGEKEFDVAMKQLAAVKTPLTDFELLTVAAILMLKEQSPDYIIMEAGMGGRFDSTNIIEPLVSIITSISKEHTAFLGDTIEEIAWHKAGIIKQGKPVVIGELPESAHEQVKKIAEDKNALVFTVQPYKGSLTLKGAHQEVNASLAWTAVKQLLGESFIEEKAVSGLAQAAIPFRFEEVYPGVIFDGAHNEASINALVETIKENYPNKKIHIVMGLIQGKDYLSILKSLENIAIRFTFIDFKDERAMPAKILFSENISKIKTIQNEYDILPVHEEVEVTIVTGSLYLLSLLKQQNYEMFRLYN